jgi:hypothetical protein
MLKLPVSVWPPLTGHFSRLCNTIGRGDLVLARVRCRGVSARAGPGSARTRNVEFDLRRLDTGTLVRQYASESAALAFVRDVVRIAGHDQAATFALDERDAEGNTRTMAEGADLVRRALEDRAQ